MGMWWMPKAWRMRRNSQSALSRGDKAARGLGIPGMEGLEDQGVLLSFQLLCSNAKPCTSKNSEHFSGLNSFCPLAAIPPPLAGLISGVC